MEGFGEMIMFIGGLGMFWVAIGFVFGGGVEDVDDAKVLFFQVSGAAVIILAGVGIEYASALKPSDDIACNDVELVSELRKE